MENKIIDDEQLHTIFRLAVSAEAKVISGSLDPSMSFSLGLACGKFETTLLNASAWSNFNRDNISELDVMAIIGTGRLMFDAFRWKFNEGILNDLTIDTAADELINLHYDCYIKSLHKMSEKGSYFVFSKSTPAHLVPDKESVKYINATWE